MITSISPPGLDSNVARVPCAKCGQPRQVGTRCKECYAIYRAEYRARNKEAIKECDAGYRKAKGRSLKCYDLDYRRSRDSRITLEVIREHKAKWQKENREKRRIQKHNRDAKIREGGKLSEGIADRLMSLQKCKCANCRCSLLKTKHHLDHIVPVALGGANTDGNIQLLCQFCNLQKHAKDPIKWAQEQGRLL